jgi:hypothetical protein
MPDGTVSAEVAGGEDMDGSMIPRGEPLRSDSSRVCRRHLEDVAVVITIGDMKRVFAALTALVLIAATPGEVLPDLQANGYYIEPGSDASEQVVSDAVFEGRADGGRLYIVVLSEEPPGGAPTFADSTLDLLGEGYVLTVAPRTVGYAGDGTFWTADQMDRAVDVSLDGGSDDEVVELFIAELTATGAPSGGGSGDEGAAGGGGFSIWWLLLLAGGGFAIWWFINSRNEARNAAGRLDRTKKVAGDKLAEVANDILEMEDEVAATDNPEVKEHYQRASAIYSKAIQDNERADDLSEMLEVSRALDLAIWELDCAEAILDGKPKPPKPEPPKPVVPPAPAPGQTVPPPPVGSSQTSTYDRRPQRQSGGSNDLLTMLLAMAAMRNMGGRGGFGGGFGGWTGGGRSSGGGFRGGGFRGGGGGRIRGGGRRG